MRAVLEVAAHPPIWVAYVAFPVAVVLAAVAGWFAKPTRTKVKRPAQNAGLDILEPEEQVGDDTLRMLGDDTDWTEPIVLLGIESIDYAGDTCLDCGKPSNRRVPYAMSSIGRPIEASYCHEHADYAMTDEAEWF